MKWLAIALALSGCQIKTLGGGQGTTTTTAGPSGPSGPSGPPPEGERMRYEGADAMFMPSFEHQPRTDTTQSVRDHGLTGKIIEAGDTDPQYARDEVVCGQSPAAVSKVPKNVTITLTFCNTYKPEKKMTELAGLSIEEAKKRAKAAGFTGEIEVMELSEFAEGCKPDTVCRADPFRWELNQEHRMYLMVNRKLKIMTPD